MKQLSLGALAVAAALQATPVMAQQNTASMTQQEIRDRVTYLCGNVAIGSHLRNPSGDVCEYSADGGKTWILTGTGTILSLLGLGYIFRLRKRKKDEKAFVDLNDQLARHDAELSADPFTPITEIPNFVNPVDLSTSTEVASQDIAPIMVQETPLQIGTSPLGIGYIAPLQIGMSPLGIEHTDPLKLEYTPKKGDVSDEEDTSNA